MLEELYSISCRLCYEILLVWLVCQHLAVPGTGLRQLLKAGRNRQKRVMHPQSPKDCPACKAKHKRCDVHKVQPVEAWGKHTRGRRKVVATDGYACSNV